MPSLLRIDSSSRADGSHSRRLGDLAEARWRAANPGGTVLRRDLAADPLPHVHTTAIGAFFTPPDRRTPEMAAAVVPSDTLVDELLAADTLLITVPMYNFGIPSALKAWIDHVVRVGRTFAYDGTSFSGLAGGRTAAIAIAYGAPGYAEGGPLAGADFALPYLRFVLGFIGVTTIHTFVVEGTSGGADAIAPSLTLAERAIAAWPAPLPLAA
jgi:FMN-dependent NADH-azoreductase